MERIASEEHAMPFDPPIQPAGPAPVKTAWIAATCLGGVVIAVVIGVLLYAFVRHVAG